MKSLEGKTPSWWVSLIPFVVLSVILVFVIKIFGADSLEGGSQVALLFSGAVAAAISMLVYKQKWSELEDGIVNSIRSVATSLIVLLMIGAVAGSWMISGIVPTLIYYGLKVITPGIFLLATCVICALVSLMTGSSWTTIATLGVALLGIGQAFGYSLGWTAGAIISGAYFGDKISPLSDTTILASSSAGTDIFEHIRYMLITTVPSFTIACVVFLVVSLGHGRADGMMAEEIASALQGTFHISIWLLVVPVITGILIVRKLPAIITLIVASLLAGIAALIAQPGIIHSIASTDPFTGHLAFMDGFKGLMVTFYGPTSVPTGSEVLDNLVATNGMTGMLNTMFLIICAVTFGGVMTGSGMIRSLTEMLTRRITSRTGTVGATLATGMGANLISGDQYLAVILTCNLYRKLYEKNGFENRLLGRTAEDSATVTSVLVPWNSCGMTQSTVLGVPTLTYLPYCIFNLMSPLMSLFIAMIGYKIVRRKS